MYMEVCDHNVTDCKEYEKPLHETVNEVISDVSVLSQLWFSMLIFPLGLTSAPQLSINVRKLLSFLKLAGISTVDLREKKKSGVKG